MNIHIIAFHITSYRYGTTLEIYRGSSSHTACTADFQRIICRTPVIIIIIQAFSIYTYCITIYLPMDNYLCPLQFHLAGISDVLLGCGNKLGSGIHSYRAHSIITIYGTIPLSIYIGTFYIVSNIYVTIVIVDIYSAITAYGAIQNSRVSISSYSNRCFSINGAPLQHF